MRLRGSIAVLLLCLAAPAVAEEPFTPFMSEGDEARVGAEQHPQILAEFGGAYDDAALVAYIDSIGQFLALTSERPGVKFTFTVLNHPMVNAFALPGGYVYVTRGLLALADTEAEIAGVLAHEIGHVAARHGAQRQTKSVIANLGLAVLGVLTDSPGLASVAQTGAMAYLRSYSREDEFEADTLGVRYLSRAGFDPAAMSSFLNKLKAHSEVEAKIQGRQANTGFDIMATHPRTAERVERAIRAANVTRVRDPIVARDIYLRHIDELLYGDDPAQGLVRGRRFLHPDLGFQFEAPEGFTLINSQNSVIAQHPKGSLIRFDTDVRKSRASMSEYMRREWLPDAQLEGIESLTINGFEAATASATAKGQNGRLDVRLVAIAFDSRSIHRFMFVSPTDQTRAMSEGFRRTTYSFRSLSRREAGNVRPMRIRIHQVRRGDTPDSLARKMAIREYAAARFHVLNGHYPGDPLIVGRLVKIVVE